MQKFTKTGIRGTQESRLGRMLHFEWGPAMAMRKRWLAVGDGWLVRPFGDGKMTHRRSTDIVKGLFEYGVIVAGVGITLLSSIMRK